ncbi:F-actin-capping protein [Perkinsus olseni]|uniref:F-actin-capping protein subunit alpha n=1 Tax=Perkinsus olseni TaxID=32597 RepID=A0A7J6KS91_PEROL|nr:F-actin-capping protein [Perkinsus olseni]
MADSVEARVMAASPPGCLPQVLADLSVISPAVATNSNAAIQQYCESIGMVVTSSTDRDGTMTKKALEAFENPEFSSYDILRAALQRKLNFLRARAYWAILDLRTLAVLGTISWGAVPSILSVQGRTNDETTDSDMRTLADAVLEAFEGQGMTSGVWIKDGAIHIVRSSLVMRERGLWSGSWLAEYAVRTSSGGSGWTVTGSLKIRTHFWEDSNVQSTFTRRMPVSVTTDGNPVAREVVRIVHDFENKCHASLDGLVDTSCRAACKALRRRQPMNGLKFDWNVHRQTLSRDLTDNTAQLVDAKPARWQ